MAEIMGCNAAGFYFEYIRFESAGLVTMLVGDMRFCGGSCEDYSLLECNTV
jgi:hypothetical protein